MSFTFSIPNATNTSTQEQLAQAYADSVDWQIIEQGVAGNGVLSGLTVTPNGTPNNTVTVAVGTLTLNGIPYASQMASTVTLSNSDPSFPRFDLIIYRVGTGVMVLEGTAEAEPFTAFPVPTWTTDVVLAAIYVAPGGSAPVIGSAEIKGKAAQTPLGHVGEVWVDDFGADPTGQLESSQAFNAALAALPTITTYAFEHHGTTWTLVDIPVGTIRFGIGNYAIGVTEDLNDTGPGVKVFGQGDVATILWYFGKHACIQATNSISGGASGPYPPLEVSLGGPGGTPTTPYPQIGATAPGMTVTTYSSSLEPGIYQSALTGGGSGSSGPLVDVGGEWSRMTVDGSYCSQGVGSDVVQYSSAAPGNTNGRPWVVGGPVGMVMGGANNWKADLGFRNWNCPLYGSSAAVLLVAAQPVGAGGWSNWAAPNLIPGWMESGDFKFHLMNCDNGVVMLGQQTGTAQESFGRTNLRIRSDMQGHQCPVVMDGGAWQYSAGHIEITGVVGGVMALNDVGVSYFASSISSLVLTTGSTLTPLYNGCALTLKNANGSGGNLHGIISGATFGSSSFTFIITNSYGEPTTSTAGTSTGGQQVIPVQLIDANWAALQVQSTLGGSAEIGPGGRLTIGCEFQSGQYFHTSSAPTTTATYPSASNPTSIAVTGLAFGMIAGTVFYLGSDTTDLFTCTSTAAKNATSISVSLFNTAQWATAGYTPGGSYTMNSTVGSGAALSPYVTAPSTVFVDDAAGCGLVNLTTAVCFNNFGQAPRSTFNGAYFTSSGSYPPSSSANMQCAGVWVGDPSVSSYHSITNGNLVVLAGD